MTRSGDDIVITVQTTDDLSAATRASIISLCIASHESHAFEQLFEHIPTGGRHFLAHRDTELVSHAVVTTRWAQPEGYAALQTAFVDAVSTHPTLQGRGYGSAVMRRLAGEVPDYELGCLETDKPGFYERLGWELWRGPLAGRDEHGIVPTPDQTGVMVLRLDRTPPLDLGTLLSIERQSYRIWE